jgi:hypothetical protein
LGDYVTGQCYTELDAFEIKINLEGLNWNLTVIYRIHMVERL